MTKQQYLNKRQQLLAEAQKALDEGNMELYNSKYKEVQDLDANFENTAKAQANLNALNGAPVGANAPPMEGKMNDDGAGFENVADMYNSIEYRTAFMHNVLNGTPIPEKFRNAAAQTETSDVTSVIPTVYLQKIHEKLDKYGDFLSMATHTHYAAGVVIPTANLNPEATWTAERGTTDDQEVKTGEVSFSYHKLRCVIVVSFETSVVTLEAFETAYINSIVKAMGKGCEKAMFVGKGASAHEPVGILTETPNEGQTVTITAGDRLTYQDLVDMEAALPEDYEDGAVWTMTKKTFYSQVIGMVDDAGHPIARINTGINGKPEYSILGRPVKLNKYMTSLTSDTEAGTIVAAIYNFEHYCINTNRTMTIKRYTDEETDDLKTKGIMLADGKSYDNSSLVIMKTA